VVAIYSRVTIIGQQRQLDAVLPSDEPLGRLLPDLMNMLGEPPEQTPRRRYLTTPTGAVLSADHTLASAQLYDGIVLRLTKEGEVPPPPTVYDLSEEAVDDLGRRGSITFQTKHRQWAAGIAVIFAVLAGAIALVRAVEPDVAAFVLIVVVLLTALTGVVLGRYGQRTTAITMLVVPPLLLSLIAWTLGSDEGWSTALVAGVAALALALGSVLFALGGLAGGGVVGGGTIALFALVWIGGIAAGVPVDRMSAVVALLAVLLLGLIPRLALVMSGLTALDDRRSRGGEVMRTDVTTALNAAHVGLALAAAAIAGWSAAAGAVLALHGTAWTVGIAAILTLLLCSRSRLYPLAIERLGLFGAAGVVIWALVQNLSGRPPGGTLVAAGLVVALAMLGIFGLMWHPQRHVQARLGQVLDQVQLIAMLALVPLVLGAFGVFTDLLDVY
jgi:type VII secretion integral membrane protein EccD